MDINKTIENKLVAIPTFYGGCHFRSRVEARWAVFFDELGWDWRYEHEGFELPSGWYLPDFYFPDLDIYAEVKGKPFTKEEIKLCEELSIAKNVTTHEIDVLLLAGQPSPISYKTVSAGNIFLDVVFVPLYEKFYPFFYSSDFDKNYFDSTWDAIVKSTEADFKYKKR